MKGNVDSGRCKSPIQYIKAIYCLPICYPYHVSNAYMIMRSSTYGNNMLTISGHGMLLSICCSHLCLGIVIPRVDADWLKITKHAYMIMRSSTYGFRIKSR
ncbi:hypothetical protein V6N13_084378 [Hibiscus sabdariffa]|uniref:Uncharacterized protein n=1 Tax=Hibiscus sabdariffa TaxID=183260 RepID=A0ABR2T1N4_9ROSI